MALWEKTMVYTKKYGPLIYEGKKKHCGLPETNKCLFNMEKTYSNVLKIIECFEKFKAL